jgi:hypothetical protein
MSLILLIVLVLLLVGALPNWSDAPVRCFPVADRPALKGESIQGIGFHSE